MFPLQSTADPTALALVLLNVVLVFVVLFSFIWAFGKLQEGPDLEGDLQEQDLKDPGRRGV